ncbi:MAG: hypothetical protein ACREBO_09965 [Novosphingobium sp.]
MIRTPPKVRGSLLVRTALGLTLALGVAGLAASPALAAKEKPKKEEAAGALKLKLTKEFAPKADAALKAWMAAKARPDVAAAQAQLKAAETALLAASTKSAQKTAQATYDTAQSALLALVKPEVDGFSALVPGIVSNDDRYQAGAIGLDIGLFTQSQTIQRQAIEMQLASGFVAAKSIPAYNYYVGKFAYGAKEYMVARAALEKATAGGYHDGEADRYLAETYFAQNDGPGGLAVLKSANELAKTENRAVSQQALQRGLSVANDALILDGVGYFGAELVRAKPSADSWQQALYALRRVGKYDKFVLLDAARLMDRTASYGNGTDYMEYIQIGNNLGLPKEVLRAIDAGIAAGKLSRSDVSVVDYTTQANARVQTDTRQGLLAGYDRDARLPTAKVATVLGAGDSFLSYGQPAKAEEFYQIALTKPGVDAAEALTRLGIAQYDQGKYAEAQATFAKVAGPRAPLAMFWAVQAGIKAKPAG